jgi:hypothetical protein
MSFARFGFLGSRFNCWEERTTHSVGCAKTMEVPVVSCRAEQAALCAVHQASLAILSWLGRDLWEVRHSGH